MTVKKTSFKPIASFPNTNNPINVRHMPFFSRRTRRLLTPLFGLLFILVGTYLAIQFAKGYRPTKDGIAGTGLLAANSFPPGAEVYLNEKLTTATDDTLSLPPGNYVVSVKKDGYSAWIKKLTVKEELVTQTNATLFRAVPSLTPLTLSGAVNINPSPDGQKIVYAVASASARAKNGLYVLQLNSSPLSLQNSPKQIARNMPAIDFSKAEIMWSPDSTQILVHLPTATGEASNYLLVSDSLNDIDNLPDVTARLPIILSEWEEDIVLRETKQYALLPDEMKKIATSSAVNVYFSPNEDRVLYTSTGYETIPGNLITPPPATSTQPEERTLQKGVLYVYDMFEDKNFRIGSIDNITSLPQKKLLILKNYQQSLDSAATSSGRPTSDTITTFNRLYDKSSFNQTLRNFRLHYSSLYSLPFQWYPDSNHLIIRTENNIEIVEYDGQNRLTVYAGPISGDFVYPWPDGTKLIVPTNLNSPTDAPNLYAVDIR